MELGRSWLKPENLRRMLAVSTAAGSLALAGTAASSQRTASLESVGFADNHIWLPYAGYTDGQPILDKVAVSAAQRDAEAGATTIEVAEPYTQGGAQVDNDTERLCSAALLAGKYHFDLVIRREMRYRSDASLGYMPTTPNEYRQFFTNSYDMFANLYGENGCVKDKPPTVYYSLDNEPNNKLFQRNQYVNGRWVAPENTLDFYAYEYPLLHKAANEFGIDLKIIIGELDQNLSLQFLKRAAQHRKGSGNPKLGDVYAQHYYVQKVGPQNKAVAINNMRRLMDAAKDAFGEMPFWVTELGGISTVPSSKASLYMPLSKNISPMSPEQQADFYNYFLKQAACLGIARVLLWHMVDDGTPQRTGLLYVDETKKPSFDKVTPTLQTITDERLACST